MKLTTLLLVGAAALATPALAQSATTGASADTQASTSTSAAQPANTSASVTTQTAANGTASQPATNADTSSNTASNGQMAMNNGGASASTSGGADISALSSVPDTQKKYKRSSRAKDFSKEAETTKQLNQQVASAGGLPKMQ